MFADLKSAGCADPPQAKVFQALVSITLESDEQVDISALDLGERLAMFDTPLWYDFTEAPSKKFMELAQAADTLEERRKQLQALGQAGKPLTAGQSQAFYNDMHAALTLFSETAPAAERLKYAVADEATRSARMDLACRFAVCREEAIHWRAVKIFFTPDASVVAAVEYADFTLSAVCLKPFRSLMSSAAGASMDLYLNCMGANNFCHGCSCGKAFERLAQDGGSDAP